MRGTLPQKYPTIQDQEGITMHQFFSSANRWFVLKIPMHSSDFHWLHCTVYFLMVYYNSFTVFMPVGKHNKYAYLTTNQTTACQNHFKAFRCIAKNQSNPAEIDLPASFPPTLIVVLPFKCHLSIPNRYSTAVCCLPARAARLPHSIPRSQVSPRGQ